MVLSITPVLNPGDFSVKWRDPKYTLARQRLTSSIPEWYCLSVKKKEIVHLIELCLPYTVSELEKDYSNCGALFDLVEIDNAFVTADWAGAFTSLLAFELNYRIRRELTCHLNSDAIWYIGARLAEVNSEIQSTQ